MALCVFHKQHIHGSPVKIYLFCTYDIYMISQDTQRQLIVYKNAAAKMDTVCTFAPPFLCIIKLWRHQFSIGEHSLHINERASIAVDYV
jgi:hypothetical protein